MFWAGFIAGVICAAFTVIVIGAMKLGKDAIDHERNHP